MDVSPARARIVSALDAMARPATTAEVAERLGLHPNGVRAQLEALARDGVVARRQVRHGRGRPRAEWSIAEGAPAAGPAPERYEALAGWLVRALAGDGQRQVEAAGRRIGRELIDPAVPLDRGLHEALAALGFRPRRDDAGGPGRLRFCLGSCPYRAVAAQDQPTVCGLHRGITQGMLDAAAPDAELVDFVPKDPFAAGCEIEVRPPA